jgi:hypothetical protein
MSGRGNQLFGKLAINRKHGASGGPVSGKRWPEYTVWKLMRQRCMNINEPRFKDYGGRGISICERWNSFENFYADIGRRPSGASIERIHNQLGYSPGNCRWANSMEQANNKRNNHLLTANGETMTMAQWARRIGIDYATLKQRIRRGWSSERWLKCRV